WARSARKNCQWQFFSESGPAGPGPKAKSSFFRDADREISRRQSRCRMNQRFLRTMQKQVAFLHHIEEFTSKRQNCQSFLEVQITDSA
ncbi:MAG: hypothetical protein IJU28_03925, partial [Clostridia bacterium]|nr:hypothetical protein [Clostridia bacterium]